MCKTFLAVPAVVLLLASGAMPVAAETSGRSIQQAVELTAQGTKALDEGDPAKARPLFEQALQTVASFPDAHLGLGHLLLKEGKAVEALAAYEQARAGYGVVGKAIFGARVASFQNHIKQMAVTRDRISSLRTKMGNASVTQAQAMERTIAQAEDSLRRMEAVEAPKAGTLGEPAAEVHFHIGNALFRLGRIAEAIKAWDTCVVSNAKFAAVHVNLTVAHWKLRQFDPAREHLATATTLGYPVNPKMKVDLEAAAASAKR